MKTSAIEKVIELDSLLVDTVQTIKILGSLAWPAETEVSFLKSWRSGQAKLPQVNLQPINYQKEIEVLLYIQSQCDRQDPLSNIVYKTARSYTSCAKMLNAIGSKDFTQYSIEIYGKPNDIYKAQNWTALDAADFFLAKTDELLGHYVVPPTIADIPAEEFATRLQKEIDLFFVDDKVNVLIDRTISSKAIAGSNRIRLRAGAMFSDLDLNQLLQHEAHIHAATMQNGKRQKNLRLMALGSPHTTRTQEGLAVTAELLTLSLDILRLRRIALRIKAIAKALDGADFIEVFKGFLEAGQSEEESYQSTVRCFRGGDVHGKTVFTKDTVYLKGMMEIHGFLAVTIHENRPELVNALFAGRLSIADVIELAPYFENGFLSGPHYLPHWARDLRTLASALACNAFFTRVDLTHVSLESFIRLEEDTATGV